MSALRVPSAWVAVVAVAMGAAQAQPAQAQPAQTQKFPDVVAAKVRATAGGNFDFDVTVSSPYDTLNRYADGIRVRSREGRVFGTRELWHDHAGEQPFTRNVQGVKIGAGISSVVVEARDLKFGWGGKTIEVPLPGR